MIVRKKEFETLLVTMCEQKGMSDIIGNEYVVMGTLDKFLHKEGKKGQLDASTAIDLFLPFKDHWTFELQRGWQPVK
ncbi:MAG: hypothetical protein KKG87_05300 [Elusimicrobia bacterium]|nr:hypothetical protein [Elusimicrobiota bacterium]